MITARIYRPAFLRIIRCCRSSVADIDRFFICEACTPFLGGPAAFLVIPRAALAALITGPVIGCLVGSIATDLTVDLMSSWRFWAMCHLLLAEP